MHVGETVPVSQFYYYYHDPMLLKKHVLGCIVFVIFSKIEIIFSIRSIRLSTVSIIISDGRCHSLRMHAKVVATPLINSPRQ